MDSAFGDEALIVQRIHNQNQSVKKNNCTIVAVFSSDGSTQRIACKLIDLNLNQV